MEAEARYTYVGAGVLVLLAALVAAVVWLKNVGAKGDFNHFAIHFEQQALDGLAIGADVSLRGIKIGRVEDYALDGQHLNRVRVEIRVDRRSPVRTGTVAVVTRNFVTGIASIALVNPDPAGDELIVVPDGERLPVIGEGRSDLEEITGRVNKVGEMASVALSNINALLTAQNREAVAATIVNLRDLSAGLNARLGDLDRTLKQTGSAAGEIARAGTQLGDASQRIAGVVERGAGQFDRTLAEAERTLVEARRAMQDMAAATQAVQKQATSTARRLEDTAIGIDEQLAAALAEMRLSVESATRVIDKLREPRAALMGPGKAQLGPGEKLP